MINCFVLCHPQSADLLPKTAFDSNYVRAVRIACGTSKVGNTDLSESNDFFPTYAPWNSVLFETSVILTIWEHANELIGDNDVAIVHSDITPHFTMSVTWQQICDWLAENSKRAIGLTAPATFSRSWNDWLIPADAPFIPKFDPMQLHSFESGIRIWDLIKDHDYDIYTWAMDTQPRLIYSHQFACSRQAFDFLGDSLYKIARRLRLAEVGFWTPHIFERLIALYLARYGGEPILSTCFWHVSSSGPLGPGELSLYGPRPRRYYKIRTRWHDRLQS